MMVGKYSVACLLLMLLMPPHAWAEPARHAREAMQYFEDGNYDKAAEAFADPYRKGVAAYKAGDYEKALQFFDEAQTQADAGVEPLYNAGNAQFRKGDVKAASESYQKVLELSPDHKAAKHNLELAKKLLDVQGQSSSSDDTSNDNKQQKEDNEESDQQKNQDKQNSDDKKQDEQQSQENQPTENSEQEEEQPAEPSEDGEGEEDKPEESDSDQQEQQSQQQEGEEGDEQGGEQPEDGQQEQSASDAAAERLLDQLQGEPGDLLRNRLKMEQDKSRRSGQRQEWTDPW